MRPTDRPTRGTRPDREPPLVACVVLNTNRRDDTLECVRSLRASTYARCRVLVLDCQSTDGSVEAIREAFPDVEVVRLADNQGYAGNNNVGIELALSGGADWVFVLNEDVVVDPECMARLVDVGEASDDIGVLGPMVYHHDEPDVIQSAGGRLDRWWQGGHLAQNEPDRGAFREPREAPWISGCAILVRRRVIEQVGSLDARFFIYWEETEWCLRASRAGWRIVHVPRARVWHKGVQRDYRPKPSVTYYFTRNHLLTLWLHDAPLRVRLASWARVARTLASWSLRPKWRDKRPHRDAMWRGAVDYLRGRWGPMP